jgi:polar amino acid transport system permease protein
LKITRYSRSTSLITDVFRRKARELAITALVALISVADLMFVAKQINGATFLSAQSFGTALIIYYVLARFVISPGMRRLELVMARRMGRA